ncbi:hypothetical protein B0H15DRAFT_956639 [Mycena belliarum]|uniref:Uncharacterized protein n=1 Tax=Mycena belliarum TaxID=1033014 RepID=A0AAD6TQ30_9AGAR|nr:hypothetical protein B0H15DRAFT_956639 [Mycena belliae]
MDSEEDDLDQIMNRPSSPVAPPILDPDLPEPPSSPRSLFLDQSIVPPSSPSNGSTTVSSNPRKRPAEDVTQLAGTVARKAKLGSEDREAMNLFAKASLEEQRLLTYGQLLKVSRQLATIHPPDAVYHIPAILKNKIAKHSARNVLSPFVSAYKADDIALKQVSDVLLKYPGWGFTKAVKADKTKLGRINKMIQKDLTDIRCDAKRIIGDSIWLPSAPRAKRKFEKRQEPQNIISLCEALVSMPSVKSANIPVTFDMLGRVSFLRALLIKHPDETTYWEKVDARLVKIRTTAKNDKVEISKAIAKCLKADQATHGTADIDALRAAAVDAPVDGHDSDNEEV